MKRKPLPPESKEIELADIARRLDITLMTLATWRTGSTVRLPLEVNIYPMGRAKRVTVTESDLLTWLAAYRPDLRTKWLQGD